MSSTCAPAPRPGITPGFLDPACRATHKGQAFFVEMPRAIDDNDCPAPPQRQVRQRPKQRVRSQPKAAKWAPSTARNPHPQPTAAHTSRHVPQQSRPVPKSQATRQQRKDQVFFVDVLVPKSASTKLIKAASTSRNLGSSTSNSIAHAAARNNHSSPTNNQQRKSRSSFPQHSIHVARGGQRPSSAKPHAEAEDSGMGTWQQFASAIAPVVNDHQASMETTHIFDVRANTGESQSPPALQPGTGDFYAARQHHTVPQEQTSPTCQPASLSEAEVRGRDPETLNSAPTSGAFIESISSGRSSHGGIESSLRGFHGDRAATNGSTDSMSPLDDPLPFQAESTSVEPLESRQQPRSPAADESTLPRQSNRLEPHHAPAETDPVSVQQQPRRSVSDSSFGSMGSGSPAGQPSGFSDATTVVSQSIASSAGAANQDQKTHQRTSAPGTHQRRATTGDITSAQKNDGPLNRSWTQQPGSWREYARMNEKTHDEGKNVKPKSAASFLQHESPRKKQAEMLSGVKQEGDSGAERKVSNNATGDQSRASESTDVPLEALMDTLRRQLDAVQQAGAAHGLRSSDPERYSGGPSTQEPAMRSSSATAKDIRECRSSSMRASQRASIVLRESIAMPAVPEDAPMEAMETPLREFLERTSDSGSVRRAHTSSGPTATGTSKHRGLVSSVLQFPTVGQSVEGDSATTVVSDGPEAVGGLAASHSQDSTSFARSSQDLGGVFSSMQGDDRGLFPFASVSIGSQGTTVGSGGEQDMGGTVLDSGSSVLAPTFRPDSKRTDSSIILSESSISSDAGNPLVTPKKKQRCASELCC